jgi:thiol reductant ABC exporter CydD subunit
MDIDRRLLGGARGSVALVVALGTAGAGLLVAQAWLLATVIAAAFDDARVARGPAVALLCVVVARAVVAWGAEAAAGRASVRVKTHLRGAVLARLVRDRASAGGADSAGADVALATGGLDALDAYVGRYLPQRVLAVVVPLVVVAALLARDWVSAAIVAVTLPLVPLFMALVGASTHEWTERRLRALQQLAGHFLDVVSGLCTLKVFGRAKAQIAIVGDVTDRYRRSLLRTLRLSFLSALVLELLATLSVALVAVAVGLRALGGSLDLQTALFVLVLAPEAYLPLRELGASYHAGADGAAVARRVFAVLDRPLPRAGTRRVPLRAELVVEELSVAYPGRPEPVLDGVSLRVAPGEVVAVTGPSGCGKSTLLGVILGLVAPCGGSVRYGGAEIAELDPDAWHSRIAWVPQRPYLLAGTVIDNVRLARADATPAEVRAALALAGLATVPLELPLGDGGTGLSAGERRRIALARAFLRDAPLLLLDEPTASLDGETERAVLAALTRLAEGRTVIVVAHRPALVEFADREIRLPECARATVEVAA